MLTVPLGAGGPKPHPRLLGARCESCLFSRDPDWNGRDVLVPGTSPIPDEEKAGALFAVVGEAPGEEEVKYHAPFIGASGKKLADAMLELGVTRGQHDLYNVCACIGRDTLVQLADGSWQHIWKLVRDQYDGEVRAVLNGVLVNRPVTGWYKTPLAGRRVYEMTYASSRLRGAKKATTWLTEDHRVLTRRGWVRADSLQASDQVAIGQGMSRVAYEVAVGSMLGDAGMHGSAKLLETHSVAQEAYVLLKAQALRELDPVIERRVSQGRLQVSYRTRAHRALHVIRAQFTHGSSRPHASKKRVPTSLVLTPRMLAVWFMDDGYMRLRDHQLSYAAAEIAAHGFAETEITFLQNQIETLGIKTYRTPSAPQRIKFDSVNSKKLSDLVAPYCPPIMRYKLHWTARRVRPFDAALWTPSAPETLFDDVEIREVPKRPRAVKQYREYYETFVYCLDVEEAHNFVTSGGVVHNCRPPNNDMAQALRKAKAAGLPSPIDCCRPRLLNALRAKGHTRAIALGGTAAKLLMQSAQGIFALRGGPATISWPDLLAGGSTSAGDEADEDLEHTRGPAYLPVVDPSELSPSDTLQVLPTFHPAFVARSRRWRPIFLADLGRAFRLFSHKLRWTDPAFHYQPTADALYHWLATAQVDGARPPFWTFDYETTIADPLTNEMLCLGIGLRDEGYCIGLRSCEDGRRLQPLYAPAEEKRIREVITWFFQSRDHVKVAHNAYFDNQVTRHHFGVELDFWRDTILIHRLENSELPHGLGVVGSIHTDVTSWKNDHDGKKLATHAQRDVDLWKYNVLDCVVTWRILPPMVETVHRRQLQVSAALGVVDTTTGAPIDRCPALPSKSLMQIDHARQGVCMGMHRNGVYVFQDERERLEKKYTKEAVQLAKEIRAISEKAGWGRFDPDSVDEGSFDEKEDEEELADLKAAYAEGALNPGSYDNIRDLLYEKWGLVPVFFTDTGLPSTSNLAIRTHLADRALTRDQRAFLDALRRYRRIKDKYLGTYIRKARLADQDGIAVHIVEVMGKRKLLLKPTKAYAWPSDGRIRATWNSHVTPVGRYACSNPNLQNQPKKVRSMYGPGPGHVWVKADLDQAHLRVIANRWKIARLIECFHTGQDPHMLLGLDLFGEKLRTAEGWDGDLRHKPAGGSTADKIRDTSKTLRYTGAYKASCPTIWKTMTRAENKAGELIYLDLTLREVTTLYAKWMHAEPEWRAAWDFEIRLYEQFGFTCDSIFGRRCDFTDWVPGEEKTGEEDDVQNAIINYPILTSEASVMGLAELEVLEQIPFEKWGPGTGIVAQVHDELVVECPDDEEIAAWTKGVVQRAMNRVIPGWDVPMTADAAIARRWKEAA